jgi:hypothetical protein
MLLDPERARSTVQDYIKILAGEDFNGSIAVVL